MSYYSNINGNVLLKSTRIYRYRKWSDEDEGIFLTVLLQICPLGIRFRKGIRSSQRTISQHFRLRRAKIYIISVYIGISDLLPTSRGRLQNTNADTDALTGLRTKRPVRGPPQAGFLKDFSAHASLKTFTKCLENHVYECIS